MEPETKWLHGEVAEDITTQSQHPAHKTIRGIVLVAMIAVLVDILVIVATQPVASEFILVQLLGRITGFGIALFLLQRLFRWILRKTVFAKDSDWTALIIAALIYLAVFSFFAFATTTIVTPTSPVSTSSVSVPTSIPVPTPALKQNSNITNPDYIANPSAYLVDQTGKIASQIPSDKPLWVEQILGPTKIKVSYITTQSGSNIVEVKSLLIPGLGWPKLNESGIPSLPSIANKTSPFIDGNCWSQQAQAFLSQNVLHQPVYFESIPYKTKFGESATTGQLLISNESNDERTNLASFVVKNGYGVVPFNMDVDYGNTYPGYDPYRTELYSDQQVASLAKRGAWGVCGGA